VQALAQRLDVSDVDFTIAVAVRHDRLGGPVRAGCVFVQVDPQGRQVGRVDFAVLVIVSVVDIGPCQVVAAERSQPEVGDRTGHAGGDCRDKPCLATAEKRRAQCRLELGKVVRAHAGRHRQGVKLRKVIT